MAVVKFRLKRKNDAGTYDTYHLESEAGLILRASGTSSVEDSIAAIEKLLYDQGVTLNGAVSSIKTSSGTELNVDGMVTLPAETNITVSNTGSGNAITSITANGHSITVSKGSNYVVANTSITPKTAAKITYDAKGLVTSGDVLTASDIPDISSIYIKKILKGAVNGIAELDDTGKVPSTQLPSYVDDIIEGYYRIADSMFYSEAGYINLITTETGKIYVDLQSNKVYRWSGSVYVVISETLALGETSSTAYRGDRGKIAYDHSQIAHAPSNANYYTHPTYTGAETTSSGNLTSGGQFVAVNSLTIENGHISGYGLKTYTLPASGYDISDEVAEPTTQNAGDFWFEALA